MLWLVIRNFDVLFAGGFKEIPDLVYSKSLDLPRRTRQIAWRTRLEKTSSLAQVAVEVG